MTVGGSRGFDAKVAHPARVYRAVPSGSYLTISHAASDISPAEMAEMIKR